MARPSDAAISYAERRGWAVFPCCWHGKARKRPLTRHGLHGATLDRDLIREWWRRWPKALVGVPTGRSTAIVLDIDRKNGINGFDTLDELGAAILPDTPLAHTASGGLHVYFRAPAFIIRNTAGAHGRGLGRGLDLRGDGCLRIPTMSPGYSEIMSLAVPT